jgi:cell shape-determining protein MreC
MKNLFFVGVIFLSLGLVLKNFQNQIHSVCANMVSYFNLSKDDMQEKDYQALVTENYLLKEAVCQLIEEISSFNEQVEDHILSQMKSVHGRVIFREPASWGSYFWIDKGSKNGEGVVCLFSPVVSGQNLVGMIDYVSDFKSRVRLITHSKLPISIELENNDKIKGEVMGGSYPLWRSSLLKLKGSIFMPLDKLTLDGLIITSGFDGIFPRGLQVAKISSIESVKEGAIKAEFEAKPVLENLIKINYVQILPSIKNSSDYIVSY